MESQRMNMIINHTILLNPSQLHSLIILQEQAPGMIILEIFSFHSMFHIQGQITQAEHDEWRF